MEAEVLIKVENVSKKFAKSLKKSLFYGVQDVCYSITGRMQNKSLRNGEFWAVKDISFEVRRGECLGLIGHNGAGKSTLLKMLNGLISPDEGTIAIKGKIGALIELGAGFNPILTGRENIYNNAAIIGFTKKEIDEKLDEIIAFAELEEFIDMPVQNYSSGMKVRLGFAVAAQMEPDVLIIDEVLAVGDLGFRIKCINRIHEILKKSAVIFVSHTMNQISSVCTGVLLLNRGENFYIGKDVGIGIEKYFLEFNNNIEHIISDGTISIVKSEILNVDSFKRSSYIINSGDTIVLKIQLKCEVDFSSLNFRIGIFNVEYKLLAEVDSRQENFSVSITDIKVIYVRINKLYLKFGKYSMHIDVRDLSTNKLILRQSNIVAFLVKPTISVGADFLLPSQWSDMDFEISKQC